MCAYMHAHMHVCVCMHAHACTYVCVFSNIEGVRCSGLTEGDGRPRMEGGQTIPEVQCQGGEWT